MGTGVWWQNIIRGKLIGWGIDWYWKIDIWRLNCIARKCTLETVVLFTDTVTKYWWADRVKNIKV